MAVLASSAVLVAGPAAAAQSTEASASSVATPGPWQSYSYAFGDGSWVRQGRVAGQPGNAHSGHVSFDTSDDPVTVFLYDWRCPAGEAPPTTWNPSGPEYNDTTCGLLRTTYADATQETQQMPTFSGPLYATFRGLLPREVVPPPSFEPGLLPVRLTWYRTGPVTTTVEDTSTPEVESRTTTQTAPMALAGRIGWVDLRDPRNHASVQTYVRETLDYRSVTG